MASDASVVTSARRPCSLFLQRRVQPLSPPPRASCPGPASDYESLPAGLAASAAILLVLEGGPEGGGRERGSFLFPS